MGVPEGAAKHALYTTGNNSADMAVMWYFDNMDNPVLQTPLRVKKASGIAQPKKDDVPQDLVDSLVGMLGFPEKKVKKALKSTENNPDRAADWLFSHADDPDSDEADHEMTDPNQQDQGSPFQDSNPGIYDLTSTITHLGAGILAGHYVSHVRQADDTWVYFNDAKVAQTTEPPIGKGYMYFFRKRNQ